MQTKMNLVAWWNITVFLLRLCTFMYRLNRLLSTAYGGRTFFQELENPVLVSLVVKQAVDQGSYNPYVLGFPQSLIRGQLHPESQVCQMRNCYGQRSGLFHLCKKN